MNEELRAGYVIVSADLLERLKDVAYCAELWWEEGGADKECPPPESWGESPPGGLLLGIALSYLNPGDSDPLPLDDDARADAGTERGVTTDKDQGDVMDTQLLTVRDVVRQTRLHRSTIHRAVKEGDLKVYRIGRAVRIHPRDLRAWLDSKRV